MRTLRTGALAALVLTLATAPAGATAVKQFRAAGRADFAAGTLDGIAIDPAGRIELADRVEKVASIEEPFLLSAAALPDGWVVGTGNAGKVIRVGRDGGLEVLFTAPEPEVFAVWADPDGTVFAGTSPRGKVYRIAPNADGGYGPGEEHFDPGQDYIWALARGAAGALLVATGTEGKLFRVNAEGRGEVFFDADDTHLRSLAVRSDGKVLVGTAEEGLVLEIAADGAPRTLYDADQPEVVALATGPGGTAWAAVVASEASLLPPPAARSDEAAGEPEPVVTVNGAAGDVVSGLGRGGGPRSVILRLAPSGRVETVWSFSAETVYSLLHHRGRLWVGTGLEGQLYSHDGDDMVLEKDVDERQIVALLAPSAGARKRLGPGPAFATTNAAALFALTGATERRGTYTSPALDAGRVARFGNLHWEGELPSGAGLAFAFRSGISSEPDRTWSAWSAPRSASGGPAGEVAADGVPAGRYLQWRAELEAADGRSPRLNRVEISYRQENLKPTISQLSVLEPGQVLVPANFNPTNQVYEPAHPNRDGIFTTLTPDERSDGRQKTLWKKGFRSLTWEAEDANDDPLTYTLAFRPAFSDEAWMPVAEELEETYYSFDATVLPDGVYRFRLTASDGPGNGNGEVLTAERTSEPVVIDHSPPSLASARRSGSARGARASASGTTLELVVEDTSSPLTEAVVSVDAGPWQPVSSADGLVDGRREVLTVEVPAGARLLLLRLTDAAHNVVTVDLSERLQ